MSSVTTIFSGHIVPESEIENFLFQELLKLIDLYNDGAITFMDLYYKLTAEINTLGKEKVLDILKSPTRETLYSLFQNSVPTLQINGLAIPRNSVVVVKNREEVYNYYRKYPILKPVVKNPVPLGIMSSLKAISSVVKGMNAYTIVIPDLPWKHVDALATLVLMCRLANIKLISNTPIVFREEIPTHDINPRLLSLANEAVFLSTQQITSRFKPALRKFIEDYGLQEKAELYGINIYDLPWREDWWNYLNVKSEVDQKLLEECLKAGLPEYVARKIASWKVYNINSIIKLIGEIYLDVQESYYREKAVEIISNWYNVKPEVIRNLLRGDNP